MPVFFCWAAGTTVVKNSCINFFFFVFLTIKAISRRGRERVVRDPINAGLDYLHMQKSKGSAHAKQVLVKNLTIVRELRMKYPTTRLFEHSQCFLNVAQFSKRSLEKKQEKKRHSTTYYVSSHCSSKSTLFKVPYLPVELAARVENFLFLRCCCKLLTAGQFNKHFNTIFLLLVLC